MNTNNSMNPDGKDASGAQLDRQLQTELECLRRLDQGQLVWPESISSTGDGGLASARPGFASDRSANELVAMQALMADQAYIQAYDRERKLDLNQSRGNVFTILKQGFLDLQASWMPSPRPIFRSEGMDIVYSDIVALGKACVLLELANNQQKTRLRLEPGGKNDEAVQISLYKGDSLFEKLLLQTRVSWDLDGFAPGVYRLDFGHDKSFQFSIQE